MHRASKVPVLDLLVPSVQNEEGVASDQNQVACHQEAEAQEGAGEGQSLTKVPLRGHLQQASYTDGLFVVTPFTATDMVVLVVSLAGFSIWALCRGVVPVALGSSAGS